VPQSRTELETLAETESTPAPRRDEASVLAHLVCDPETGYEPREIAAETPVSHASVYRALQRLRERDLVEEISGHYLVNADRVGEARDTVLTSRQLTVAESISDRNTAPEEVDPPEPEDIEVPDDDLLSE
jgi:DNA-binding transcriptional MocR family regulator